jgi:hypothetical protein
MGEFLTLFLNRSLDKTILFCLEQRLTIVVKKERVFHKRCQQVFNKLL